MYITVVVDGQTWDFYKPAIHQFTRNSFLSKFSIADFIFQHLNIHTFYGGIFFVKPFNVDSRHFCAGFYVEEQVHIEFNNSINAIADRIDSYTFER